MLSFIAICCCIHSLTEGRLVTAGVCGLVWWFGLGPG